MRAKSIILILLVLACGCSGPVAPGKPGCPAPTEPVASRAVANRAPLRQGKYIPLPLGSIKPRGWLHRQLGLMAKGISGRLDEGWADVDKSSAWLGGNGEAWERGPYFLDGLVPLAYSLDEPVLKAKAKVWVDAVLARQRADGSLGPGDIHDWWPRVPLIKALCQYQEATQDPRIIPALKRYFSFQADELATHPLQSWAIFRWEDAWVGLAWYYNRTGDALALEIMDRLRAQGYDWDLHFEHFDFTKTISGYPDRDLPPHGVNNAMGLKAGPLEWLRGSGGSEDGAREALERVDRFDGQPEGVFSSDENLAGREPTRGVETCTVVETLFSLEQAFAVSGDTWLADRLEWVAFNALPAPIKPDACARQYLQQANQVLVDRNVRPWTNTGFQANLFGLETEFGCCTANLHQGWPKFTSSLWMATPDNGLAAVAYAPCKVAALLSGLTVTVDEETEYPFDGKLSFIIHLERPASFPIYLRIPAWVRTATCVAQGKPITGSLVPGRELKISRAWKDGDSITLGLSMPVRTSSWDGGTLVERGPLLFVLAIKEQWHEIVKRELFSDWEIKPASDWNYGLDLKAGFQAEQRQAGENVFSPDGSPVALYARGRLLPDWVMVAARSGPVPQGPQHSAQPLESLTLLPYAAAKLRITVFPVLCCP